MKKPADPDIISAAEVAALLGSGKRQVYEAAARGDIPAIRLGRKLVFSRCALSRLLHGETKERMQ